jgi:hypothetical protein
VFFQNENGHFFDSSASLPGSILWACRGVGSLAVIGTAKPVLFAAASVLQTIL